MFMQRFIFLSTIIYSLLLAGLVTLQGRLIALAIPFVLYLLYGFYNTAESPSLQIERRFSSERVTPDSDVLISIFIKNNGNDIEELYLEDRLADSLSIRRGSNRHLLRLPKGSSQTVTYTLAGPRGAYRFESISVEVRDMLGLITQRNLHAVPGQLLVFPEMRRLQSVAIHPRKTRVFAGQIPARAGGAGTEFFGVREYQPGDSPRSINWHASARHAESLYANEFQQERVADVGIVLDARERANLFQDKYSIFEHSVVAAAAISDAFITQGNRVGLLVYGSYLSWTFPGYGKVQREKILQSLAGAVPGASTVFEGLEHLSSRMFPPQSQIVLVSSLVYDDLNILIQMRARGYQVMVVSPDAVKFELGLLPASKDVQLAARIIRIERDLLIKRLERAGVRVVEWDVSRPFDQALGAALKRAHSHAIAYRRTS
jgi:uncharacterized protein (DUF58 family)